MKKTWMTVLVITTFFVISGCQTQPKKQSEMAQPALTNQQLMTLYSEERKVRWNTVRGSSGTTIYNPDGTGVVEWGKGDHQGQWRIVENFVCTRWEGVRDGAEKCFSFIETAPGKYNAYNEDGSFEGDNTIISQ
ncbi:hypothetical protein [Neptunomonas sp.]|uniref:hypothetical protein n=1 Tax=Neptunomonas sp. TaxID=1971898 RepID=UPI003566D143